MKNKNINKVCVATAICGSVLLAGFSLNKKSEISGNNQIIYDVLEGYNSGGGLDFELVSNDIVPIGEDVKYKPIALDITTDGMVLETGVLYDINTVSDATFLPVVWGEWEKVDLEKIEITDDLVQYKWDSGTGELFTRTISVESSNKQLKK